MYLALSEPEPVRGPVTKSHNNPPVVSKPVANITKPTANNHPPAASPTNSPQAFKPPAVQKPVHRPSKPQNTPQATKTYVQSSKPPPVQKPAVKPPSNLENADVLADDFLPVSSYISLVPEMFMARGGRHF